MEIALSAEACDAGRDAGADVLPLPPELPERAAPPNSDTAHPERAGTVARSAARSTLIIAALALRAQIRGLIYIQHSHLTAF